MNRPTEDTPATPGWVEQELDEIQAKLPHGPAHALAAERGRYLDCLAGLTGPEDPLLGRQRCHAALLARLDGHGLNSADLEALSQALEQLEANFAERS